MILNLQDTPEAIIRFLSMDYPEIPDVLDEAKQKIPKYKGSVQPYQAAFLYWLAKKNIPNYAEVLEIGTGLGYTSWIMGAASAPVQSLITTLNPNHKEVNIAVDVLQEFDVDIVDKTSRDWFEVSRNKTYYDLVFVDGNHKDIEFDCKWYDCLTENGVIVFHDYSPADSWSPCLPVWNKLNEQKQIWGEPDYLVVDDGNVGMVGWKKKNPIDELTKLNVEISKEIIAEPYG